MLVVVAVAVVLVVVVVVAVAAVLVVVVIVLRVVMAVGVVVLILGLVVVLVVALVMAMMDKLMARHCHRDNHDADEETRNQDVHAAGDVEKNDRHHFAPRMGRLTKFPYPRRHDEIGGETDACRSCGCCRHRCLLDIHSVLSFVLTVQKKTIVVCDDDSDGVGGHDHD